MSDMIEVQTADLIGAPLNWVMAKIEGVAIKICLPYRAPAGNVFGEIVLECQEWRDVRGELLDWSPSTDWSQGGPLIEKYQMDLTFERKGLVYSYQCKDDGQALLDSDDCFGSYGETHLIAVCRAIVAATLGDVVQIPAVLVTP